MKRITSYFKSRDKPQNRTAGSAYTFYMGGTTSGKAVTERSAMQMTAQQRSQRSLKPERFLSVLTISENQRRLTLPVSPLTKTG